MNGALVQGFLYQDGLRPIAELDGAGNVVSRFVYATERNVPDYMVKGGVTYRIVTDHLGSPRLVVDAATGQVAQRMDYDEFGQRPHRHQPRLPAVRLRRRPLRPRHELVRFGARDYDPETGRWTAKDPILFDGGAGQPLRLRRQRPGQRDGCGGIGQTQDDRPHQEKTSKEAAEKAGA